MVNSAEGDEGLAGKIGGARTRSGREEGNTVGLIGGGDRCGRWGELSAGKTSPKGYFLCC